MEKLSRSDNVSGPCSRTEFRQSFYRNLIGCLVRRLVHGLWIVSSIETFSLECVNMGSEDYEKYTCSYIVEKTHPE